MTPLFAVLGVLLLPLPPQDGEIDRVMLRFAQRRERVRGDAEFRALLAEVRGELQAFLNAHPRHADAPRAAFHIAEAHLAGGDPAAGADALRRFLADHAGSPQAPVARFMLGEALLRAEDDAGALEAFREFQRLHADDERGVYAKLYEAVARQNLREYAAAEALLREVRTARAGAREGWSAALQLAVLLHAQEKNAEARALLEELMAARPDPEVRENVRRHLAEYLKLGREAPDLDGRDLDARPVSLRGLRGKVAIVHFFDPALTTAAAEASFLAGLRRTLRKDGAEESLALIGVCLSPDRKDLAHFRAEFSIDWPILWDGKGLEGPLARRYEVAAQPALWLVDRAGRVRFHNLAGRDLLHAARKLIQEK
jgi:TolA-binding protein/peroxiredoxin